jgi:nicotinate-nucleotide adenylyltransferase
MAEAGRTIGLFGGSFNPPHVAHQLVALFVLETQEVDALWLVPTYRHALGKTLAPFADRVAMCALAAAPLGPRIGVSRIEEELAAATGRVSRTLETLEALAARHPADRFRLVVGSDILGETEQWYRWDDVVRRAPPIVIGRAGHPAPPGASVAAIEMPRISSTEIRERLARGETAVPLVPRAVMGYIAGRTLYDAP